MANVRIEFQLSVLQYDPKMLDSHVESDPFLYVFASKRSNPFSTVQSRTLSLSVGNNNNNSGLATRFSLDAYICTNFLRESIGMVLYCKRKIYSDFEKSQSYDYHRYVPIAEAVVFLEDMRKSKKLSITFRDPSSESDAFRMMCQMNVLSFDVPAQLLYSGNSGPNGNSDTIVNGKICDLLYKNKCINFDVYKDEYIRVLKEQLEPSELGCQSVHVPYWKTVLGNLMGPLYASFLPRHRLDENYILYCLDIILDLKGLTRETMRSIIQKQLNQPQNYYENLSGMLAIIAEVACLFANTCDYLPDVSKRDSAERFIDIIETLSGDCEDMAKNAQVILESLKRGLDYLQDPLLRAISSILQFYQIVLATTAVTSASATSIREDELGSQQKNNNYMCHICTLMIPNEYIVRYLFNDVHSSLKQTFISHFPSPTLPFEEALPILTCEGTNFVNPLMHQATHYVSNPQEQSLLKQVQKQKEGQRLAFEGRFRMLKRLSVQAQQMNIDELPQDPSKFCTFYRKVNELWIDFGLNSIGPVAFAVTYQPAQTRRPRYGVWFKEFLEKRKDVRLYTMYVLSKEDLDISTEVINRLQPMRNLTFHPSRSASIIRLEIWNRHRTIFDELNRLADLSVRLIRSAPRPSSITKTITHYLVSPHYTYYSNHINKLTPKILRDIEALINSSAEYGLGEFKFFVHPLTDDGELYLIEIRFQRI